MIKVKICGITNLSDARECISCGADFLGFVFYEKSKRFISADQAKKIIEKLPKKIKKVGVFVNEAQEVVKETARSCGLDYLQFHGSESPLYLAGFKDFRLIKAFRIKGRIDLKELKAYKADYFLFDTFSRSALGGTGKVFNWKYLNVLKKIKVPFFVSGGLTPENVSGLVKILRPFCVDVSSGVEKTAGEKDLKLVKRFIQKTKAASRRLGAAACEAES